MEEKVLEEFNIEEVPTKAAPSKEKETSVPKEISEAIEETAVIETTNVIIDSEVTLDDLDDVPESEKFRKVRADEKIELKELTISNVKLGKPLTKDETGNFIEPEVNSNGGKYYKAKLIVEFAETIDNDKIREFIPSIFYSVNEEGIINPVPTIPKACPDAKLADKFTSEVSKIRNKYGKFIGQDPKQISSAQFIKGLMGKKVSIETETGEFKQKAWQKIKIIDFLA